MNLLERISRLVTANINHLLDKAEDPEVMIKQLIRDMEQNIIEMRRETVRAVAREKQLQKQIEAAGEMLLELEGNATLALSKGDEAMARKAVGKKLSTAKAKELMEKELEAATRSAEELKTELSRLEDRVQEARRKKEELIARNRAATAHLRSQEAIQRSSATFDSMASAFTEFPPFDPMALMQESVIRAEAEAAAMREVLHQDIQKELDLQQMAEEHAIDEELERLRKEHANV